MSDGLDLLIHRHLDGTLGEEEATVFEQRLRTDPAARRRLAEMAFDHVQLKELLESAGGASRPSWSRWHLVAAASILLAVGAALLVGPFRSESPTESAPAKVNPAPRGEDSPGFRGRVHARVLERRDKARIALKVSEVLSVRDGSLAAGDSIFVVTPRVKEGDAGPERDHAAFLAKLQTGQEVVLDLRHAEGTDFAIASLTAEQAEWARRDDRKKTPGDGLKEGEIKKAPPLRDGDLKKPPVKDVPKKAAPREGDKPSDKDER